MSLVLTARDDGVATVTLNRPEAMNALSRALRADLASVMRQLAADAEIRAIVLTGAGSAPFPRDWTLRNSVPIAAICAPPMRPMPTRIR